MYRWHRNLDFYGFPEGLIHVNWEVDLQQFLVIWYYRAIAQAATYLGKRASPPPHINTRTILWGIQGGMNP